MLLRWAGVAVLYLGGLLAHEVAGSRTSLAASNVLAPSVLGYNVVVWRLNAPAGARANLFTRFYQVDQSATRSGSGVGLGLALVKGYVEAQGGRVWYERGEPGARFRFSLPLASAPAVVEPA